MLCEICKLSEPDRVLKLKENGLPVLLRVCDVCERNYVVYGD